MWTDGQGYFWRVYYVQEPEDSPRNSRWVFKISREYFMDMDKGLGPPQSPEARTPLSTEGAIHWGIGGFDPDGSGGSNMDSVHNVYSMTGDVIATLDVTKKPEAEPIPGKWTHVTFEWNWDNIYDFRRGTVGGGEDAVSYPVYLPHDYYESQSHNYRSSLRGDHIRDANTDQWLPIVATPRSNPDQRWEDIPQMYADRSTFNEEMGGENVIWPVPHMEVNGKQKTRTDLFMGNVNPITGKFQPPNLLYAEHVVWDGSVDENSGQEQLEDSEIKTSWHYMRHWTMKHYGNFGKLGSNFARRTKRYGELPQEGDWQFNWARFYDDGFANGTIDEFYWVNIADKENPEPFQDNRYVDPQERTVRHVGYFHRGSEHSHDGETYWNESEGSELARDKFNYYAEEDQKVLAGEQEGALEITQVAHTQYRPRDGYRGRDYNANGERVRSDNLSESERPYFDVSFRTESGEWLTTSYENEDAAPGGRWLGEPVSPEQLFDEGLNVEDAEDLKYRLEVENARTPMNVTPFFEDVTVIYEQSKLKSLWYYNP